MFDEKKKLRRLAETKGDKNDDLPLGTFATEAHACKYFDNTRLTWQPKIANSFFIPTRYQRITQTLDADCYDPAVDGIKGDEGSSDRFKCSHAYTTTDRKDYYVADIENFKLTFHHQFESTSTGLHGNQKQYAGFLGKCESNHPKDIQAECQIFAVPGSEGEVAEEDSAIVGNSSEFPTLGQTDEGADTISVHDLLQATPLAIKYNLSNVLDAILPDEMEIGGRTLRDAGGTLILSIDYGNTGKMRPGLPDSIMQYLGPLASVLKPIKPITYVYRPYFLPAYQFRNVVNSRPPTYPKERVVEEWHGIQVNVLFHGKLVAFDFNELLAVLTTSLTLLAASVLMVDMFACYNPFSSVAPKYKTLKFQPSEDFTNFFELDAHKKGPLKSTTPSSALLLSKLTEAGKVKPGYEGKISDEDLVKLLNFYEMRLNRLDAMDVECSFQESTETDPRNYNANNYIHEFVFQTVGMEKREMLVPKLNGLTGPPAGAQGGAQVAPE